MPHDPAVPVANRLLATLPRREQLRLLADCEPISLAFADILAEPGELLRHVYFPLQGFISLTTSTDRRNNLEVALIGREAMIGATVMLGVDRSPFHALVQGDGLSLRMPASRFRRQLDASPALQRVLKRYLFVLISQLTQAAACARFHVVEERLARWLLMTHDRAESSRFHITHDFLAYMLGVRRVGVTKAASELQRRQLIAYSRGDIQVIDRIGLEAAACSCYQLDTDIYRRVFA